MFDYKRVNFRINFFKLIIISSILIPGIRSDGNDDDFCWDSKCTRLGQNVLRNMLPTLDPCQDFYEYACGNFTNNHPPPTPYSTHSVLNVILRHIYKKLSTLLSKKIEPNESNVVKRSKQLFQACMNLTQINKDAIPTMKKKMDDIGGFPMMYPPDMFDDSIPWEEVHYYFAKMTGSGALVNIDVNRDYRYNIFYSIYLDQPSNIYGIFTNLTNPTDVRKYSSFIKDVVMILIKTTGTAATEQDVEQDIQDVFKFRESLQKAFNVGPRRHQPAYGHFTLIGLQQATPAPVGDEVGTDWFKLFKGTFSLVKRALILSFTPLVLREPNYILDLVRQIAATKKRTIINHIHLYFLENHLSYMPENIMALLTNIRDEIRGQKLRNQERWQTCSVKHPMQHVLSSIYIHYYFPQTEMTKVSKLVADIKNTTKGRIERASWLDAPTKRKALLKLNAMKNVIGGEDWYRNYGSTLQEYYAGQNVGNNYLQNILSYEQNEYKIELGYWTGETTRVSNNEYPILPNAYYKTLNHLILNVGQMQPPFYNSKFPPVVNYPGLGTVIAHEMSHAFGDTGRKYDQNGRLVNWWSRYSAAEYKKKSKCLVDQFNGYGFKELEATHPDWRVKGDFTLEENFADLLGVMVSYETYKTKMQQPIKPSRIGALRAFDNEKVFFLIYANTFCEYTTAQLLEYRTKIDIHTTGRLRVNGPLANMPEFSRAFNCPPGPMNRATKCQIW